MYRMLLIILAAATLVLAAGTQRALSQQNKQDTGEATPQLEAKVDRILAGQEEILSQLDQIKQELEVIKVRATR